MDLMDVNEEEYWRQRRKKIIIFVVAIIVIAIEQYNKLFLRKQPYRGDTLRGYNETERIIGYSDTTSRRQIRMTRRAFFTLCKMVTERGLLQSSRSVTVEEQLVMFLNIVGHDHKNRVVAHNFGHSGETSSRYFNRVLRAIIKLHPVLLRPPTTTTHHRIADSPRRYFPYFKDCIGAIDGSHVDAWVPVDQHRRFCDRKGNISQNILAACDFDMNYTFILAGWEGSASNSRLLDDALNRAGEGKMVVPRGKFYLVDAGFANQVGFLRPYRNVRYHLKEWRNSELSPVDKYELFNLRHSQLRNVIERSFGLLKSRFKILKCRQPEFSFKTQAMIVIACVLLHNHILTQNHVEDEERWLRAEERQQRCGVMQPRAQAGNIETDSSDSDSDTDIDTSNDEEMADDHVDWDQFREDMADKMWADWVNGDDEDEDEQMFDED